MFVDVTMNMYDVRHTQAMKPKKNIKEELLKFTFVVGFFHSSNEGY